MTLGDLVQAEAGLKEICGLKLAATAAYRVAKLTRIVAADTKHFHDTRGKLARELGQQQDGGYAIPMQVDGRPNPKLDDFVTQMTEVSLVPVTLDVVPLTISDLGDNTVSASTLLSLGALLTDKEPI